MAADGTTNTLDTLDGAIALRAARDGIRRQAVDTTSREITGLDRDRVAAIVKDTDDDIAALTVKANAVAGPARQRLESAVVELKAKRDALESTVATLQQKAATQWHSAQAELDVSMRELTSLQDRGLVGVN